MIEDHLKLAFQEVKVDHVIVRVPRETFAATIEARRDDYAEPIGELTPIALDAAQGTSAAIIALTPEPR